MVVRKQKSMDANNAAAWVSYAFTEVAGILGCFCLRQHFIKLQIIEIHLFIDLGIHPYRINGKATV